MAEAEDTENTKVRLSTRGKLTYWVIAGIFAFFSLARQPEFGIINRPYVSLGRIIGAFIVLYIIYVVIENRFGTPVTEAEG